MTEQLYYQDSYIKDFEAVVLFCIPNGNHFEAVLDRTAFFPEGGGQCADTGVLHIENRKIKVFDVQERNGEIIHFIDEEILPGQTVIGEVEFQERFSKMQQHTGEHIISGIVHRRFGYENVGFHLGKEEVTMDYDGPLTGEELRSVEYEANQVVAENREIKAYFPSTEELEKIPYRSKKNCREKSELWKFRIVISAPAVLPMCKQQEM